jgi:hypothetical protein
MKKKKNIKFRAVDLVIIVFCLTGAFASGSLFWLEYNRTLTRLNEEPVGVIVFKKRVAQRRFIDRVVWDRLKQASPVYNGDTIRTIEHSVAYIAFRDQVTYLNLDESTLVQIFYDERRGARIDFSGGNLDVGSGEKGLAISSGGSSITVTGQASLNKDSEGFGLSVLEGRASFDGAELETGGILALDASGEISAEPIIVMTSFGSSAQVLGKPGEAFPVYFAWNASNFNAGTHVIVEIAADRGFGQIVQAKDVIDSSSVAIPLECGTYWWRAFPAHQGSMTPASRMHPSGTLDIIPAISATLLTPAHQQRFTFSGESHISFSWTGVEAASEYLIEISANAGMSVSETRLVAKNSATINGLEAGTWYWRVTPVFPSWVKGSVSHSAVYEFTITRGNLALADPVLTFPPQDGAIDLDSSLRRLLWAYDANATSWLMELSDKPGMDSPLVTQNVLTNYYSLPPELLKAGQTWYWRVSAMGGESPAVSAVGNFAVIESSRQPAQTAISNVPPEPLPQEPAAKRLAEPEPEPPPPAPLPSRRTQAPPRPITPSVVAPPPLETLPSQAPFSPPSQARPEEILQRLLQVSGTGTVSGNIPVEGYNFTSGQLENATSLSFTWEGRASEYRFVLLRANGQTVVSSPTASAASYALENPGSLTEGFYVWQVFERDGRGDWGALPSTATRFTVSRGAMIIRELQAHDPGVLYGN